MRYFERDSKLYIGPVVGSDLDVLNGDPLLKSAGISCHAAPNKLEIYLTIPDRDSNKRMLIKTLLNVRYGRLGVTP